MEKNLVFKDLKSSENLEEIHKKSLATLTI